MTVAATRLPTRRHVERWFAPFGRGLGMWAYVLNRVAGLGLVVYLYLHLGILTLLSGGAGSWNAFVAVAKSPLVLALDVLLIAGVLVHGLNGVRVALLGVGFLVRFQKPLFLGLMATALLTLVASVLKIYGVV
jgi:succinate dehydrogenase / fumarate reductase cytochrome b subunit